MNSKQLPKKGRSKVPAKTRVTVHTKKGVLKDIRYLSGDAWWAEVEKLLPKLTPEEKKDFERHGREVRGEWG